MGKLDDACEEVNDTLGDAEDALFEQGFGIPASIDMGDGAKMWWRKEGPDWEIAYEHASGVKVRATKCSLSVRVACLKALPKLHDALVVKQEGTIDDMRKAIADARAWLGQFLEASVGPDD